MEEKMHRPDCSFQKTGWAYCNCDDIELEELVKALIAIPIWSWKEGMLVRRKESKVRISVSVPQESFWLTEGWLPVLSDFGTGGVLFWMLSRYCKGEVVCETLNGWVCKTSFGATSGTSLGEACARMLILINQEFSSSKVL